MLALWNSPKSVAMKLTFGLSLLSQLTELQPLAFMNAKERGTFRDHLDSLSLQCCVCVHYCGCMCVHVCVIVTLTSTIMNYKYQYDYGINSFHHFFLWGVILSNKQYIQYIRWACSWLIHPFKWSHENSKLYMHMVNF